jgi:hypothetical protein
MSMSRRDFANLAQCLGEAARAAELTPEQRDVVLTMVHPALREANPHFDRHRFDDAVIGVADGTTKRVPYQTLYERV